MCLWIRRGGLTIIPSRGRKSGVDLVLVNNSLIVGAVAKTGGVDLLKY